MTVRAAGGLLWQGGARERLALVYRARHQDWSLPKGKLEQGEDWLPAALREVEEETGWRAIADGPAGAIHYHVKEGPKEVRFWHMLAQEEVGRKDDGEVAEVRFVTVEEALRLLTHEAERDLLRKARA